MDSTKNWWNADAPLVIAHRGASSIAPENTIPAFKLALEKGADAIELDVKMSRDGVLIIHHDQTLDRTTNGSGRIAQWNWSDLTKLDAGSHYSTEFKNVRIPSLEEVFDTIGDRLLYNLELTEYSRPMTDIVSKTVNLVETYGLQSYVLYSSFNPIELFRLSRLVEYSQIALLMHERTPKLIRGLLRVIVPHSTYHPVDSLMTEKLLLDARLKGKRINVWTVNDRSRMRTLCAWGVDGIITDVPEQAVDVRKGLGKSV